MTARLDISHREDHKGIELIATQLTDPSGNTALVADIVAGNLSAGTSGNLAITGNLTVSIDTAITGNVTVTGTTAHTGDVTVGNITSTARRKVSGGNIAAAGSVQGNATAITKDITWVTAADGAKGALLPVSKAGMMIAIKNDDTANGILKVWPAGSESINAITGGSAISMAAKTSAIFCCQADGTWFTVPLLPS